MEEQRFHIDSTRAKEASNDDPDLAANESTTHLISHDPWYQAGFVLIAGVNSAYALGYSGIIMVPLGWVAGTLGLIVAALMSLYASLLLARLHQTGGKRHIRYRDLAGHIYGKKMYYVTWALQYINLFMINTGYIILAGQSLKAIYKSYSNEAMLKLPYCIIITGIVCSLFAFGIPHLSALRVWLGVSSLLSLIYILVAIGLSARDGHNSPARDYGISGSRTHKIFSSIAAAANLVFVYNTGMLPEIQVVLLLPPPLGSWMALREKNRGKRFVTRGPRISTLKLHILAFLNKRHSGFCTVIPFNLKTHNVWKHSVCVRLSPSFSF